jgi:AcrR family transcriptional regulator
VAAAHPTSPRRGRGRPAGDSDTRPAILEAARACFAERGYDQATIRDIAAAAAVDPALLHHHFGTKHELFLAAMRLPIDPGQIVGSILAGDSDRLGERIVRTFLTVWDSPAGGALAGIVRSAVSHEPFSRMLTEFMSSSVLTPVVKELGVRDAKLRVTYVASQLFGLALARYILRIEPLASTKRERVVTDIAPTIQRYLTESLTNPAASSIDETSTAGSSAGAPPPKRATRQGHR